MRISGRADGVHRIVGLLQEYGVDINKISKVTGQHKETVRYRYNTALRQKGMTVEAAIDEGAFGLKPVGTMVSLTDEYLPRAKKLWRLLHELAYLRAQDASLTDGRYFLRWAVPEEKSREFRDFVLELEEHGIFEGTTFYDFSWARRLPMAARYYDFKQQRWDFDWKQSPEVGHPGPPKGVRKIEFDLVDLVLAIELLADAGRSMREINATIGVRHHLPLKYATLNYHYYRHLLGNGLMENYVVSWQGAQPGARPVEARLQMSRYIMVNFLARRLNQSEREMLMGRMTKTPFLWAEAGGNDYLARCAFPAEMSVKGLEFMRDSLRLLKGKTEYFVVDQRDAEGFTINDGLWDPEREEWRFDKDKQLEELEKRLAK